MPVFSGYQRRCKAPLPLRHTGSFADAQNHTKMAHILAKIKGAQLAEIEKALKNDFLKHAAEGLFLEHLWRNQEKSDEIVFLFRTTNLEKAREFMDRTHTEAVMENPEINLPEMIFLEGK